MTPRPVRRGLHRRTLCGAAAMAASLPIAEAGDDRHVHAGPGFVTRLDVDKVQRFSGQCR